MVGYIYKYENLVNHKVYIGQTTDLVNRQSSHRSKSATVRSKFYNAVRKYGWDKFSFCILATIEAEPDKITNLLDTLEIEYISQYNSYYKGYNSTFGGHSNRGALRSEEYKEYCRNRQYSPITRKKMSESAKNKKVSDKTKQKISAKVRSYWKNDGYKHTAEQHKKAAKTRKESGKYIRTIEQNQKTSLKLKGRIAINNKINNKFIFPEDLPIYLEAG